MLRRTLRRLGNTTGGSGIGQVHPDVMWGYMQGTYLGPGWVAFVKQLPLETFTMQGGGSPTNINDRSGVMLDPEDPRHPIGIMQWGHNAHNDGAAIQLTFGKFGEIPSGSRLLQLLYDNYLEPFSMHRVCGHLYFYQKVPNKHHELLEASVDYLGQTAALSGQVICGIGSVVMEGVTIRGDTNCVYIAEGCQILENCCICSDAPSDLLAYQRMEALNPYQQWDGMDGVCRVHNNTIIEPNCYLDSCSVGPYNRIGHNTKIMKGAVTGTMVHILPGSVVLANTRIGDGELWGGAPAVKLGKVSKFEWKRPYYASVIHRENITEAHSDSSRHGDQVVHWADATGKLNTLMIEYEKNVPESVRLRIREFVEGKEPFHHMVTRISQGWSPSCRPEERNLSMQPPLPSIRYYAEHNNDSTPSKYNGTYMNITNMFNDFRW